MQVADTLRPCTPGFRHQRSGVRGSCIRQQVFWGSGELLGVVEFRRLWALGLDHRLGFQLVGFGGVGFRAWESLDLIKFGAYGL